MNHIWRGITKALATFPGLDERLVVLGASGEIGEVPSKLELDFFCVGAALVFHADLRSPGDADAFASHLDAERFIGLKRVGEASQLGDELGHRVHALNVPHIAGHRVGGFCHLATLTEAPFVFLVSWIVGYPHR